MKYGRTFTSDHAVNEAGFLVLIVMAVAAQVAGFGSVFVGVASGVSDGDTCLYGRQNQGRKSWWMDRLPQSQTMRTGSAGSDTPAEDQA